MVTAGEMCDADQLCSSAQCSSQWSAGKDEEALSNARELLLQALPRDVVVISEEVDSDLYSRRASADISRKLG